MVWLPFEEFKSIFSKVPRLTVEVILVEGGAVALARRDIEPWKGMWHLPGGTVYHGESLVETVKRVAKDEMGVEVEVVRELGHIEYPSVKIEGGFDWPVGVAFLVKKMNGDLRGNENGKEVKFFSELPEELIREQREFLEEKDYQKLV